MSLHDIKGLHLLSTLLVEDEFGKHPEARDGIAPTLFK